MQIYMKTKNLKTPKKTNLEVQEEDPNEKFKTQKQKDANPDVINN